MKASDIYPALQHGAAANLFNHGIFAKVSLFDQVCRDKTPKLIKSSFLLVPLLDRIAKEADIFLQKEISVLPFSLFKLFDTTGNRLEYEGRYFDRRKRLLVLALSSWLWERPPHISALEDTIWAICDEYSWCLPAHMEGASLGADNSQQQSQRQSQWLDLFACETGFALAETMGMLGSLLNPAILNRMRAEITRRVINSYTDQTEPQKWELMDNNWCAVCAGSIACTAMYLIEDNAKLADILERLIPTFDRFIAGFSSDGVCMEGLSYWTYGVGFYTCFADLLFRRTAGAIDLLHEPGFDKIARFQQLCYFPGGATLQFSDASSDGKFRLGLSCYLAEHIEGVSAPLPLSLIQNSGKISLADYSGFIDHCGRFSLALRDLLWASENMICIGENLSSSKEANRITALPGAEWLLCTGANETGFAAKGGHNDEPHNHNDVGSFIFYKKGAMFLLDMGAGEYTKDYFSDQRYTIFCNTSESHNLPIIDGQGQKPGREFAARNCAINAGGSAVGNAAGSMILDLAPAYDIPELRKLEREFHFDTKTGILTLRDSFTFSDKGLPLVERFIFPEEPKITDGLCSLNTNGTPCSLQIRQAGRCSEKIMPRINSVSYRDHEGKNAKVFTVDFEFHPSENFFGVEFIIG